MKKLSFAFVGAAALALAACGGQDAGENAAENLEAAAENLEAAAENAAGNEAEVLENQAEALEDQAENVEDAVDAADANAANVNAM
jgi:ABC-type glycerol-3-phosphate transport system substrate-binding protein